MNSKWAYGGSKRIARCGEVFLVFDMDISTQFQVRNQLMPGTQWKWHQRLCILLCSMTEQSHSFIVEITLQDPTPSEGSCFFGCQQKREQQRQKRLMMRRPNWELVTCNRQRSWRKHNRQGVCGRRRFLFLVRALPNRSVVDL